MQTKSEMINRIAELAQENAELKAYKDVNEDFKTAWEELKAENERLREEIKEVKKYQYEQEFLEKEIEEQREKNKRLTCKILEVKALNETLNVQCTSQDCTQLRKLHQTLQEIKAIVEKEIYMKQNSSMNKILNLITKAEEE